MKAAWDWYFVLNLISINKLVLKYTICLIDKKQKWLLSHGNGDTTNLNKNITSKIKKINDLKNRLIAAILRIYMTTFSNTYLPLCYEICKSYGCQLKYCDFIMRAKMRFSLITLAVVQNMQNLIAKGQQGQYFPWHP